MRRNAGAGTHFLVLSHTLLNYLSALGAHRDTLQLVLPDDASAHAASHLLATLDARAPRGQAGRRTRVAGTTGLVPALAARAV